MQGSWELVSLGLKKDTDKSSGGKLVLEETSDELAFGAVLTARHREQFGRLVLQQGKKVLYDGAGKLIQTDMHAEKEGGDGTRKFQFVPTIKLSADQVRALFCHLGVSLHAEWFEDASARPTPDHRPKADEDEPDAGDDNVVPGSNADHMKQNARKKLTMVPA